MVLKLDWLKLLCLMLGLTFGMLITGNRLTKMVNNNTEVPFLPSVIIDAGHGGFDGGASGAGGIVEKDINLSIAVKLQEYCRLYGLDVIMVRTEDTDVSGKSGGSLSDRKKADMKNRLRHTVDNPNSIFISIHQNKFPESKYWGGQVFYGVEHEDSPELAKILQKNIRSMLQPDNARETKKATKDLYLLYYSKVPSVIVECGFLSNPDEATKLSTPEYQQKMAYCIFTSIVEYLY